MCELQLNNRLFVIYGKLGGRIILTFRLWFVKMGNADKYMCLNQQPSNLWFPHNRGVTVYLEVGARRLVKIDEGVCCDRNEVAMTENSLVRKPNLFINFFSPLTLR